MQPDWWKYLVDVAQILSAIGTCGAVAAALWIANKPPKLHINAFVGLRVVTGAGTLDGDQLPEYVMIGVTNAGANPFVVTSFNWSFGPKSKVSAYQNLGYQDEHVCSSPVNQGLNLGQTAHYFLPAFGEMNWLQRVSDNGGPMLEYAARRELEKLELQLVTSSGVVHKIKPEKPMLDRIWDVIEKQRASALVANDASA
ncbi:MAG: hypothetical protein JWP36_1131 [Paucimonas sp.]|nr:hypothetical protein [Paucimonas sp.]